MAWLGREELLEQIFKLEPNYSYEGLSQRKTGELFHIYQYLLRVKKRPRPTAVEVLKVEECIVDYAKREEFLYPDELEMMYPDGGKPLVPDANDTLLVNLESGDGFPKKLK